MRYMAYITHRCAASGGGVHRLARPPRLWMRGADHPLRRLTVVAGAAASSTPPRPEGDWFTTVMGVRDYELDQYSVVNNAVYSSYFQHARCGSWALC